MAPKEHVTFNFGTKTVTWGFVGVLHRTNGPALVRTHSSSGNVLERQWKRNGAFYRDGEVHTEETTVNGCLQFSWKIGFYHGMLHRFGAPARMLFSKTGRLARVEHYVYNCRVPEWSNVCTGEQLLEVAVLVAFLCLRAGVKHVGPLMWEYIRFPLHNLWGMPVTLTQVVEEELRLSQLARSR